MKYLANVATLEFFPEKCSGCGLCTDVCPHAVFEMKNKRAVLTDKDKCMECGACMKNCEVGAIKVDVGVGCAAAIIHSLLYGGEPTCDCTGTEENSKGTSCC